ncbi:MAG: response regulator transcription factor [Candidatus Aminicenantes bacterium]|nr:response regulator transcription factor [Candidatus Aminicenantes bacterium]
MKRILIIEDDVAILRGLKDNLEYEGYEVLSATDGEQGYDLIREKKPDLVILDLMLPRLSGYEVCRKVRAEGGNVPILILTARGEEVDKVHGLNIGADDYMTKPFSVRELLARIQAIFRRASSSRTGPLPDELRFHDVIVDFLRFEATKSGRALGLSRKEFGVLRLLAARSGEVVTRDELLDAVWGYDRFPTTRTVDNHVALLRAKIEDDPARPRFLLTIRGVGYKLVVGT